MVAVLFHVYNRNPVALKKKVERVSVVYCYIHNKLGDHIVPNKPDFSRSPFHPSLTASVCVSASQKENRRCLGGEQRPGSFDPLMISYVYATRLTVSVTASW